MVKHENAIISRMVQTGAVRRYDHILKADYFNGINVEIYQALRVYEGQYGTCIDVPTFKHQFPEFEWIDSEVQVEWFADELSQDFVKAKVIKLIRETEEEIDNNPKAVTKTLQLKLTELAPYTGDLISGRVGLIAHGRERLERMRKRNNTNASNLAGITTGFAILDKFTNGTQEGEIEFYVARPGNGKSLSLLYGCFAAWEKQGKKVSFISPEMTAFEMGLRLDAMMFHMSQMRMQSGSMREQELEQYSDAIETLIEGMHQDIMFRDTEQMQRKFTTGDVRRIIEEDKPDLLAIDGILLIEPLGKYKDLRSKITQIMDELKAITTQTKVPLRLAHQANRESESRISRTTSGTKQKKAVEKSPLEGIPHLHELAESGSTEQYANRVFCTRLDNGRIWYAIRKNRTGPEDCYVSARFDIDTGTVTDERLEDKDNPTDPSAEQQLLPNVDVTLSF